MKKILAAVLLALPLALSAQSTFVDDTMVIECTDVQGMSKLMADFGEEILVRDKASNHDIGYSLWVNPVTRSWTFIKHTASTKRHCAVAFGSKIEYSGEW